MKSILILLVLTLPVCAQTLTTQPNSNRAIAIDAVRMTTEPFLVRQPAGVCSFCQTRVMLFGTDLSDTADATAEAEDSGHHIYPLTVERIDRVPEQPALFSISVILRDDLEAAGEVSLRMTIGGALTNTVALSVMTSDKFMAFEGDSLTEAVGAVNFNEGYAYLASNDLQLQSRNFAMSGSGLASLAARAAEVDSTYRVSRSKNILSVFIGANDLRGDADPIAFFNSLAAYCQARRAAGWKVIVMTVLPQNSATFNAKREIVNTLIRTNSITFADQVADFAAEPTVGIDSAAYNTTLYYDGTHLTAAGQKFLAPVAQTAIQSLLSQ